MSKKKFQPEQQLQMACVEWLELQRRMKKLSYFSVPNGGKKSKLTGWILKLMGQRAGIPDLVLLFPGARTLFVELKIPRSYPSPEQKEIHEELRFFGFEVHVLRSLDALIQLVQEKKGTTL